MKALGLAGIYAVIACASLTACFSGNGSTKDVSRGVVLLVSSQGSDGRSGPQAAFDGSLIIAEDNCLQGQAADGATLNVMWPSGTHINHAGDIDTGFGAVQLDTSVTLGGSYIEAGELTKPLPESCRTGTTFHVHFVKDPLK